MGLVFTHSGRMARQCQGFLKKWILGVSTRPQPRVPKNETTTPVHLTRVVVLTFPLHGSISGETTHFGFPRRSWTVAQSRQTVGGCFESKKVPRMKNSKNRKRNIPHISRERKRTGIALIINCKKKKGEEEEVGRLKMTSAFQFLSGNTG